MDHNDRTPFIKWEVHDIFYEELLCKVSFVLEGVGVIFAFMGDCDFVNPIEVQVVKLTVNQPEFAGVRSLSKCV